jgi:hypothetical protein
VQAFKDQRNVGNPIPKTGLIQLLLFCLILSGDHLVIVNSHYAGFKKLINKDKLPNMLP